MKKALIAVLAVFCMVAPLEAQDPPAPENFILRGDVNNDTSIDLADGVLILRMLFQEPYILPCWDAADINDDGLVDVADAVNSVMNFFIADTQFPPLGYCEYDTTPDNLGICYFTCN